jgi:hypothetical protein
MQSKKKQVKYSTKALIYFLKIWYRKELQPKIPIYECKIFNTTLLFLSSLSIAQKRILLLIKKGSSFRKHQQELIRLQSNMGFAETAMKETKSSKVLADYAQEQGFRVTSSRNTYRFYCWIWKRLTHHRSFRWIWCVTWTFKKAQPTKELNSGAVGMAVDTICLAQEV